MHNTPMSHQEVIFITYDDVIKSPKLEMLKMLSKDKEFRDNYKEFINMPQIDSIPDSQLSGLIVASPFFNILKTLAIKEFDFDTTYIDLLLRYPKLIEKSKPLAIATSVHTLMKQSFVEKIYIYSEHYNDTIYKDIFDTYGSGKVIYVTGEFNDVINRINKENRITSYILNNIEFINNLIELNAVEYTNIIVAAYGYNYKIDSDKKLTLLIDDMPTLSKNKLFKFTTFGPDNSTFSID